MHHPPRSAILRVCLCTDCIGEHRLGAALTSETVRNLLPAKLSLAQDPGILRHSHAEGPFRRSKLHFPRGSLCQADNSECPCLCRWSRLTKNSHSHHSSFLDNLLDCDHFGSRCNKGKKQGCGHSVAPSMLLL